MQHIAKPDLLFSEVFSLHSLEFFKAVDQRAKKKKECAGLKTCWFVGGWGVFPFATATRI